MQVVFPQGLLEKLDVQDRWPLIQALEQDPRPKYQDDPERVYGMLFADRDILFRVNGDVLTVTDVT